jgi:phage protein D
MVVRVRASPTEKSALAHPSAVRLIPDCRVSVDGKKLDVAIDARLTKVEVDLDVDLFGQCVLVFNDPALTLINGKDFQSGTRVMVEIGFASRLQRVFAGEVVALEPQFRRDMPTSLRVVCQESLHRLALSQMTRAFNDVDDKEIVSKLATEHGLSGEAPAGSKQHVLQGNITDAVFLRRLAQKHGNHLRIEGKKLIIGPPPKGAQLTIGPGDGLRKVTVRIQSNSQVEEISVHGYDSKTKKEFVGKAKGQGVIGEGSQKYGKGKTLSFAGHEHQPADTATAEAMAKGRMRKLAEGHVVATIESIGDPGMLPGATVKLEKLGAEIDGTYRVEKALHQFSKYGYFVKFRGVRVRKKAPAQKALKPAQAAGGKPAMSPAEEAAAKDRARHGIVNPRWGKQDHEHADYGEMIVDAKNIDGKIVEFIAYHQEPDGNWTEFVRKHVIASGTEVRAKIKLLHEDHPDSAAATKESKRPVAAVLSNPRWAKTDHAHAEDGEMIVDVRHGNQGAPVVFIVERKGASGWERYGTVEAKVESGQARGTLSMLHPSAGSGASDANKPVELRFTANIDVETEPRNIKFDAHVLS